MNDYLLNMIDNPTFSPSDFAQVGLTIDNTSLLDKNTYINSPIIQQQPIFQTNGKFDQSKFDKVYTQAKAGMNALGKTKEISDVTKDIFSYHNFTAPEELRADKPEFDIVKNPNPFKGLVGLESFGLTTDPTQSLREQAESHKIWDSEKGIWLDDSPNDRPLENFTDNLVLAQWDFNADKNGKETNDPSKIVYQKGQLKTDKDGLYYYETLGDRNIYGRQVLSGFDTLTTDGSAANKIDFLDSDDREKSTIGSFFRAAAQVIPAFIPGVNEYYIGARVALSLADVLPAMGKTILGSDNKALSKLEAFSKATTFSTSDKTQGSAEEGIASNPFTMETGLNLVASVFDQLAEQRWIFKYGTAAIAKLNPKIVAGSEKEVLGARQDWIDDYIKKHPNNLDTALNGTKLTKEELAIQQATVKANNYKLAENALKGKLQEGQKLGSQLSLAYMTGITTASSYQEAKEQGASDIEAALYTLGYTVGEYSLLQTDLGKWILPELKQSRQEHKLIGKVISGLQQEKTGESELENLKWYQKLFNYGKKVVTGDYNDSTLQSITKMTGANMLSEGTEEVSEDVLQDVASALFNASTYLTGSNTKLSYNITTNPETYLLDFIGGTVGGGLASTLPSYQNARQFTNIKNMSKEQQQEWAYKRIVDICQNNEQDKFLNDIYKTTMASKDFSFTPDTDDKGNILTDKNGNVIYKQDSTNSQDNTIKQQITTLVNSVNSILSAEGGKVSSNSFLHDVLLQPLGKNVLKDYRYNSLLQSPILGTYVTDFNKVNTDIVQTRLALQNHQNKLTDIQARQMRDNPESQEAITFKAEEKELNDKLIAARNKLKAYKDGTMAQEYIQEALFSMSPGLASAYAAINWMQYAEQTSGKKFEELSEDEKAKYQDEYSKQHLGNKDIIDQGWRIFKKNNELFSKLVSKYGVDYFSDKNVAATNLANALSYFQSLATRMEPEKLADIAQQGIQQNRTQHINDLQIIFAKQLAASLDSSLDLNTKKEFEDALNAPRDLLQKLQQEFNITEIPDTVEKLNSLSEDQKKSILNTLFGDENKKIESSDQALLTGKIKEISDTISTNYDEVFKAKVNNIVSKNLDTVVNNIKQMPYLTPAVKQTLKDFFDVNVVKNKDKKPIIDAINSTQDSPINELLSGMLLTLQTNGAQIPITEQKLSKLLSKLAFTGNTVGFQYDPSDEITMNIADNLINIARSHILAAKTEFSADLANTFGYNAIINEISKQNIEESKNTSKPENNSEESKNNKSQNKSVELPQLTTDQANSILNGLSRIQSNLNYYRAIYQANTGNILTEHKRTVNKVYKAYRTNIQRFIAQIPDNWNGKQDLVKVLSDTSDIENDYQDSTHTKLLKDKIKLDLAINKFFNDNKDLTIDQISSLFDKFNLLDIPNESINPDMTSESDIDMIQHIMQIAAVDQSQLYNLYKDCISDKYVPVIGQEEAIMRALSFIVNPDAFSKFVDAYNNQVKKQIDDYRKSGKTTNPWIPSKGYDYPTLITAKRQFFIQGAPGTGKSSAVLTTTLEAIKKMNPDLLKNVWVVSNTKQNADSLAKSLGLNGVQTMASHGDNSYMEKISVGYNQQYKDDGTIDFKEDDVIPNKDSIYEFKNTKVNTELSDTPSFVIIDEATSLSQQDQILNDKFLSNYNTYALLAGDFDQLGAQGSFETKDNTIKYCGLNINNYIHSLKLGQTLRANNNLIQENINKFRNSFDNFLSDLYLQYIPEDSPNRERFKYPMTLAYAQDDTGLYGNKVLGEDDDVVEWQNDIKFLIEHLPVGEQLNFIYDDKSSQLYQFINNLDDSLKSKVNFITAGASQGQEGTYYIVNLHSPELNGVQAINGYDDLNEWKNDLERNEETLKITEKSLYTGLSRAKQGALIVIDDIMHQHLNSQESVVLKQNLNEQQKRAFSISRKNIISNSLPADVESPKINWTVGSKVKNKPAVIKLQDENNLADDEILKKNQTKVVNIKNEKPGQLNMMVHTMMCQETGCTVEDDKDPMDNDAVLHLSDLQRYDSLNGLAKLNQRVSEINQNHPDQPLTFIENLPKVENNTLSGKDKVTYLTLLNQIRNIAIYGKDANKVASEICSLLGLDSNQISVDYIYKAPVNNDASQTRFQRFIKDTKEFITGIFNKHNKNQAILQPHRDGISIIVSAKNTGEELLEVPIALQTSPITMLQTEGFEELKKIYEDCGQSMQKFLDILRTDITENKNIPHLKEMYILTRVYNHIYQKGNKNTVVYFKPGYTLAKDGHLTGIQTYNINTVKGQLGKTYVYTNDYNYQGDWMTIKEYKDKMPWRKISKVYALDTNYIDADGDIAVESGAPFILVSDQFEGTEHDMLQQYFEQEKNPNSDKLIRRVYVSTPLSNFDTYFYNLCKLLAKGNKFIENLDQEDVDKNLGNKYTPFRILQRILKDDSEFTKVFKEWADTLPGNIKDNTIDRFNALKAAVDNFKDIQDLKDLTKTVEQLPKEQQKAFIYYQDIADNAGKVKHERSRIGRKDQPIYAIFEHELTSILFNSIGYVNQSQTTLSRPTSDNNGNIIYKDDISKNKVSAVIADCNKPDENGKKWTGVLYHATLKPTDFDIEVKLNSNDVVTVKSIATDDNDDYAISGKQLRLNSKLDTTAIVKDFMPELNLIYEAMYNEDPNTLQPLTKQQEAIINKYGWTNRYLNQEPRAIQPINKFKQYIKFSTQKRLHKIDISGNLEEVFDKLSDSEKEQLKDNIDNQRQFINNNTNSNLFPIYKNGKITIISLNTAKQIVLLPYNANIKINSDELKLQGIYWDSKDGKMYAILENGRQIGLDATQLDAIEQNYVQTKQLIEQFKQTLNNPSKSDDDLFKILIQETNSNGNNNISNAQEFIKLVKESYDIINNGPLTDLYKAQGVKFDDDNYKTANAILYSIYGNDFMDHLNKNNQYASELSQEIINKVKEDLSKDQANIDGCNTKK